ncbi:hypothetical protein C9374_003234 [Naegleria lovaniensis]|uniref:Uncharacterized protein n=1 Tax=Naegleria lovaniensis TaxID=51637 RepID=A0AA88KL28_NAELO|nr:uncharacterized protein C9374_011656 [Naegleria lovaniensis]XP_044549412.1 uncharacterized protein C9374_003234 [Naegleria lovaniensis]KAG2373991.1 hypothetical protein C9374_011656 [Naegleria lovaniensis]KAG2385419.1 hypothetical protein C9374_003234 [Naegleria lovaniensis]
MKFTLCILVALVVLCIASLANAQYGNAYNGAYGYQGGLGSNYGVAGGNYNSYARNTQMYSNQVAAVNYQPYAAYASAYRGPYYYGQNYGNYYSMPFWGYGGYPYYGGYRWY